MSRLIVVLTGCTLVVSLMLSSGASHAVAQEPATGQASSSKQPAQGSASTAAGQQANPVVPTAVVEQAQDPKDLAAKASYILGYNYVKNLSRQGIEIEQAEMVTGIQAATGGAESKYSPEEVRTIMEAYQKVLQTQAQAKIEKLSADNRAAGDAYRKEFGTKEGVKQLENGIQYEVLTAGEGEALDPSGKVLVHYTGMLSDGTVFDTSLKPKRGLPVSPVPMAVSGARLIPAFGQVLPKMKVGSKWRVCIPPEQAYGVRGTGRNGPIGPNATLVFEIEIMEKAKPPEAK